jgi:hypothetical protein
MLAPPPAIQAPPPAPPMQTGSSLSAASVQPISGDLYTIGNPTGEEQLYLELANRARANPQAEASRLKAASDPNILSAYGFFSVDLDLMVSQFSTILPAPPLAFNAQLIAAARNHTLDMFQNVFQEHTNSFDSGKSLQRAQTVGYFPQFIGENVYSFAHDAYFGHAGFEVDWGPGPGGMQVPEEGHTQPGHRDNMHTARFREVGIGVLNGNNSKPGVEPVGPQLVTEDYAVVFANTPFITGVAYYDLNGNSLYEAGEGIGGLTVTVNSQSTKGLTASSGGYTVPVSGSGNYNVTFSGAGLAPVSKNVSIINGENVKVDLTLPYTAPSLTGSATPALNQNNPYAITPVAGAVAYEVRTFQASPTALEGAENGTAGVILSTNGLYDVFDTHVFAGGTHSFHLAHLQPGVNLGPTPQVITLDHTFLIEANAGLSFKSRLGLASPDQRALVQISADDGETWRTVYSQTGQSVGSGVVSQGELSFNSRNVSLQDFAGTLLRIRFVFDFSFGTFFPGALDGMGWYIDDIALANAQVVANLELQSTQGPQFILTPSNESELRLQVRPNMGDHALPFGPLLSVHPTLGNPVIAITKVTVPPQSTEILVDFELRGGKVPLSYGLESRTAFGPTTPFALETSAIFSALGNNKFRFVASRNARGSATRFYRIVPK